MADYDASRQNLSLVDNSQEVYRSLTDLQMQYVGARARSKTDKEAADIIGVGPDTVARWENKSDVDAAVKAALIDVIGLVTETMARAAQEAADELVTQLREAKSTAARFRAAIEILDRVTGKPVQRIDARLGKDQAFRQYDDLIQRVYDGGAEASELDLLESGE